MRLKHELEALDYFDPRRASYARGDRFSNAIVTTLPTYRCAVSNPEWVEITATRFGIAGPACAKDVGRPLDRAVVPLSTLTAACF